MTPSASLRRLRGVSPTRTGLPAVSGTKRQVYTTIGRGTTRRRWGGSSGRIRSASRAVILIYTRTLAVIRWEGLIHSGLRGSPRRRDLRLSPCPVLLRVPGGNGIQIPATAALALGDLIHQLPAKASRMQVGTRTVTGISTMVKVDATVATKKVIH